MPAERRGSGSRTPRHLQREDKFSLGGYVRLEAWPSPGYAKVKAYFDANEYDAEKVKTAITSPMYNTATGAWDVPLFEIEGYDPYGLND